MVVAVWRGLGRVTLGVFLAEYPAHLVACMQHLVTSRVEVVGEVGGGAGYLLRMLPSGMEVPQNFAPFSFAPFSFVPLRFTLDR